MTTVPSIGTNPGEGRKPNTPFKAAGRRIDPPSSDPTASGTNPAATPAPAPPLDAPAVRVGSQGFRVSAATRFTERPHIENSGKLVLPSITAPAFFK
jgi:hypothetical protein